MLELVGVHKSFDGLRALDSLSFKVEEGEILGMWTGPNGVGEVDGVQCHHRLVAVRWRNCGLQW